MTEVRQTAGKAFVEKVQRLAGVTGVFLSSEGGTIHFWTVIGAQHKNIRRNVYECELAVMKQFPAFEYDFHPISRPQKAIEEQLPPEAQQIFSRSARDAIRARALDAGTAQ